MDIFSFFIDYVSISCLIFRKAERAADTPTVVILHPPSLQNNARSEVKCMYLHPAVFITI
jgi:hypothetical protein